MVLLHWTRWLQELKIEKSSNNISSLANGSISKYLHRSVLPIAPLPKIAKMVLGWTKMVARANNRKTFKRLLLHGQWPNFKVILQKCYSYSSLPKLLKCKVAARVKIKEKNPLNDIFSLISGPISKWFHRNVPLIPFYQKLLKSNFFLLMALWKFQHFDLVSKMSRKLFKTLPWNLTGW